MICNHKTMTDGFALVPNLTPPKGHRDEGRTNYTMWAGKYGWRLADCIKCLECGHSVTKGEQS